MNFDTYQIVFSFCSLKFATSDWLLVYSQVSTELGVLLERYNAELVVCIDNGPISEAKHKVYEYKIAEPSLRKLDLDKPFCNIQMGLAKMAGYTITGVPYPSEEYLEIQKAAYKTIKMFLKLRALDYKIESCVIRSPILAQCNLDFDGAQSRYMDINEGLSNRITWKV